MHSTFDAQVGDYANNVIDVVADSAVHFFHNRSIDPLTLLGGVR